jgi:hypothetical protein
MFCVSHRTASPSRAAVPSEQRAAGDLLLELVDLFSELLVLEAFATQGVGPVAAACLRKLVCSGPIRVGRDGGLICAGCALSEPPCGSSAFTVRQAIKSSPLVHEWLLRDG